MRNYRGFFNVLKVILVLFMFIVTGIEGCSCSKPFIEKIEIWIDRDTSDNEPFEEQVIPIGLTYKIPKNTSFRIKVKTQEPLSDNDLANSIVQINSNITINLQRLEDNVYKADYDNLTGTLDTRIYNVNILITHSGKIISQSIVIEIS